MKKSKILSENVAVGHDGKETAVENEVIDNPEIPVKDELQHDVVDVVEHPEKDVVTGLDDDDEDVPPEVNERFIKDEEISNVDVERTIALETTTEKHSTDEEEVEEEAVVDSVDIPIRRAVNTVDSTEVQKMSRTNLNKLKMGTQMVAKDNFGENSHLRCSAFLSYLATRIFY